MKPYKRTYYRFTCRILTLVLIVMAVVLFVTLLKLVDARSSKTLLQMEYEDYQYSTMVKQSQLVEALAEATAPQTVIIDKMESLGEFTITYYDACMKCCGKTDGITASGAVVREGVTVAVDPTVIPLGTYIYIEGIGYRVAQDVGGAIKGNKIDVYVNSHSEALELGVDYNVNVWRLT